MRSNHLLPCCLLATTLIATAGPYPDAAGLPGSTAIPRDSPLFVNWASGHTAYQPGTGVDEVWQTPANAYGMAGETVYDIVALGNGGSITLYFPLPVCDGAGADFAVFENSISDYFLELAFVEVSSDGTHFFRFPSASLTADKVGPYDTYGVDPTEVDGLAGKYALGFGTPFDLTDLPESPLLDKQHVRFIRLLDIIGDGTVRDSADRPIYDPTPTIGSGGFDLAAIGVIHQQAGGCRVLQSGVTAEGFLLVWQSNPGSTYQIMESMDLKTWTVVETTLGSITGPVTQRLLPTANASHKFWQIIRQ
ncbi:MAG: hypothetical protein K9N23_19610 [Akkermansiaceae bacterium]|nr:hypothetical protein [Akkermansiaceae bacterium]MCF7733904.1 hypothetical protein [Akkermansiaceae bacterium]